MPYKVLFAGLAAFLEQRPDSRVVLLPDGRGARKASEAVHAGILIPESDVVSADWWTSTSDAGVRRFPIENPSLIILSGMAVATESGKDVHFDWAPIQLDTSSFDGRIPRLDDLVPDLKIEPGRAAAIARVPLHCGTLAPRRLGSSVVAELTVPHDGIVLINAYAANGARKSLALRPGAQFVIANVSETRHAFEMYAMLDTRRDFDALAGAGVPNAEVVPSAVEFPWAPVYPTTVTRARGDAPPHRTRSKPKGIKDPNIPQAPTFTLGRSAAAPVALDAPDAPDEDVPREFYALVNSPSHVVAAVELRVTIGTTKDAPSEGDVPFHAPASVTGPYDLTLSVQATGFTFRDDVSVFKLKVSKKTPYPTIDVYLTPEVVAEQTARTIAVFYSVEGQVIGSVERTITIHLEEDDQTRASDDEQLRRTFSAPVAQEPPDLTVMIRDDLNGRLAWSFITPHKVVTPIKPVHQAIAGNGRLFSEVLINNANGREGTAGLYEFLVGTGEDVRKLMPPTFWAVLDKVATASKKETPSLLIISNEPYIPWELAKFPDNARLFHSGLAPLLGVQTCVGRWLIGDRLPPPRAHVVRHSYVVSGVYNRPKWPRLLKAEEEAKDVGTTLGATAVEAKHDQILGIFARQPAGDLLHFSMHGKSDDDSVEDGLIPIDTGAVKPQMITGAIDKAKKAKQTIAPFVFLNACQVGAGSRILGDYGGMAAAFVNGGAAGVVAPLWKVKDETAKEIALAFYQATLTEGVSPAEAIRRARASFVEAQQPVSATYLAYQFFGHPSLKLRKEP